MSAQKSAKNTIEAKKVAKTKYLEEKKARTEKAKKVAKTKYLEEKKARAEKVNARMRRSAQRGAATSTRTEKANTHTPRSAQSSTTTSTRSDVTVGDSLYERTVEPQFRAIFDRWTKRQGDVSDADIERLLARIGAAVQPAHLDLDETVGPFYDTTGLSEWVNVSRQALDGQRKRNSVIACQLAGGRWVYPTWQFDNDGSTHPSLIALWQTLRGPSENPIADPWTCALWLRAPHPDLDDTTPVDWLSSGGDVEAVETLARRDAARWAQ